MKDSIKLCVLLGLVCVVSGLSLGLVHDVTEKPIKETELKTLRHSLKIVLPDAVSFSEEKEKTLAGGRRLVYYDGYDSAGRVVGYSLLGEKQGYQSLVRVLVGIQPGGRIQGIDVLQQAETPGLGALIDEIKVDETLWGMIARSFKGKREMRGTERPWFQEQYNGLVPHDLRVIKPPYRGKGIHALTGATITSRALTDAVKESIELFMKKGGDRG